jgi:PAS domain S-box-containing protein
MPLSFEKKLPLILLLAFLMLAAIGFFAYHSTSSLQEAVKWQKHTQDVLIKLDDTLMSVTDVETGSRGFVISGTDNFLEPYNKGKQTALKSLEDLKSLTSDNQTQAENLAQLSKQVDAKLRIMDAYNETRRSQGLLNAVNDVSKGEGDAVMNQIRLSVEKMRSEELRLLKFRDDNLQSTLKNNFWMMVISSFAGIFALALANFAVYFEIKRREAAEKDLVKANQGLEKRVEERTEELEKANENLRESELFSRSVIDSLSAHIAVLDKTGKIILVNNAWENFAEANAGIEQIASTSIGQNYLSVCEQESSDENLQTVADNLRAILEGEKQHFTIEYPCHSPSEERWFLMQVNALQGSDGGVVVSHYNITDRVKAEQTVKLNEEFNRTLIESSPDCFKILDLDGRFMSMNTQGMCLMEIDDFSEFVGNKWVDTWEGKERRLAEEAFQKALDGKGSNFEGFCKTAKGNSKWWEVAVAPVRGENGKVDRVISVSREVTERKNNELERERLLRNERNSRREAEIATRLRDEFMATISHELRTPLNAILGWSRIIQSNKTDEKTKVKAVDTIIKNAETQNRLIEDLMDVSRIISGKLVLELEDLSAEELVSSSIETVKPSAGEKSISLTLSVDENAKETNISGDPNRLRQIILNLLTNAVKFTPEGGQINVSLTEKDSQAIIKIKDNGVGISEEFLPFVFERFRQDAANLKQSGGLGLGLAIVRQLTELHGGSVSVESEGQDKGATFTVILPVATKAEIVQVAK